MSTTATFDPTLPTQKDHIRVALGDRHNDDAAGAVTDPLLTDAVINAKIDALGYLDALADLAEGLAAEKAQEPDEFQESSGGLKMKWSERVKYWLNLADRCRKGQIKVPGVTRSTQYGIAVRQTTAQATLTGPGSGFRSD